MLSDVLDFNLVTIAGTPVTAGTLVAALLVILIAALASRILRGALTRGFESRGMIQEGSLAATRRLLHYTVMAVGAAIALETVGIDLAALFAAGAIFAIGLGFAMQHIAQNLVSGVIMLVERSIKPGDVLEVNGVVVRVQRMGIRATVVRTREDEDLIVPNGTLVQSAVKNFTLHDSLFRVRAAVGVVYGSDMRLVLDVLTRTAADLPWRVRQRDPRVLMTGFGSSSVDFDVSVWIEDPWDAPQRLSELHQAIWWALHDAAVTIAFPQLDLHLDAPVVESVRRIANPPAA